MFTCLALLVCTLLLEATLRCLYCRQDVNGGYWAGGAFEPDELTGFRHAAGFCGRAYRRGVFDCAVETQASGLRQANYASQVEYPKKLLLLGDSFAFGLGVEEADAFPTLIQPRLNASGVGVINGGQTGYCVAQEVAFGRRLADEVQPNVIILCICTENDVIDDYRRRYMNVEVWHGYRLRKDRWLPIAPVDYLRTHSFVWMCAARAIRKNKQDESTSEYQELALLRTKELLQPTREAIREFAGFCAQRRIKLGVLMIPPDKQTPVEAGLRRTLERTGIPFVDLARRGFGPQHCFRGDAHWNKRGHREAAEYVATLGLQLVDGE